MITRQTRFSLLSRSISAAALAALLAGCATGGRWQPVDSAGAGARTQFPRSAGFVEGADFRTERTVAPGVVHRFESLAEGPLTRSTVFVDLSRKDLVLDSLKGGDTLMGRETMLEMVKRTTRPDDRPVASINGDYWGQYGIPIGIFVHQEMIWKTSDTSRRAHALFAWDDSGNYFMGMPRLEIVLLGPGGNVSVDAVNVPVANTRTVVYTWPVGASAPAPPPGYRQAVLQLPAARWIPNEGQTVTVRDVDTKEAVPFTDRGTLVLQTRDALPEWLAVGAQARLQATFPDLPGPVTGVMGGGGWLIEKGEIIVSDKSRRDGVGDSHVNDLHPRTAVGLMPDGHTLAMVVVDGRQTGLSIGTSLPDLAKYFQELGCTSALNLDGGGSSTMLIGQSEVNFPSDAGGARAVTNGLTVRRAAPLGEPVSLSVEPDGVRVPLNSKFALRIVGRDHSGEEVALEGWELQQRTTEKDGTRRLEARARKPGGRWIRGSASVTTAPAASVAFRPPALLLDPEETADVTLRAADAQGTAFFPYAEPEVLEVPEFLRWDSAAGTVTALGPGVGAVTARFGELTVKLPVAVGTADEAVVNGFEALPESPSTWMKLQNADAARSKLSLETTTVKEGQAAWRWDYAMQRGGTTKLALPVEATLPGSPLAIGLWVYGDGQGQWIRGLLRDGNGADYYLNFTTQAGVTWRDEWRHLKASIRTATPTKATRAPMAPPFTLREVYIVQPQEAAKRDGSFVLDGLSALDVPAEAKGE